jgi:hypothetical protein
VARNSAKNSAKNATGRMVVSQFSDPILESFWTQFR